VATAQRPARDAHLLATLAEPLSPARPPWYVSGSETGHPDGWYWVPEGKKRPEYLGRNVVWTERKLLSMISNA
jgi:hypothetical protein